MFRLLSLAAALLTAAATAAQAHTGIGSTAGFAHGFAHPLGGIDHVLVMVAVGLFAAQLGGRALWLVPLSFVSVMAFGGAFGMAGIGLPFVEIGIGLSVIVLGLAVAFRVSHPDRRRDGAGRPVRDFPRTRARRRDAGIGIGSCLRGRLCAGDRAAARARDRYWASVSAGR